MSTTIFKERNNEMKNKEIREAAQKAGVKLWQLAEALGMADYNFSRKLRKEFTPEEKAKALNAIERLKAVS